MFILVANKVYTMQKNCRYFWSLVFFCWTL